MKAAMTFTSAALVCLLLPLTAKTSEAPRFVTDIIFCVDYDEVAVLECTWPACGPIKLGGWSGPDGTDESSGLLDNAVVVYYYGGSHGILLVNDTFDSLAVSEWGTYGGPSPRILSGVGNPEPCLMSCGDASYESGVYTLEDCLVPSGGDNWHCDVDAYVSQAADFHGVTFGIASQSEPGGPPGEQTLGHVIGMTLTSSDPGESVLRCRTDLEEVNVPANDWIGDWHRLSFHCPRPTPVDALSWARVKALFR